jgi:hypothetical protein
MATVPTRINRQRADRRGEISGKYVCNIVKPTYRTSSSSSILIKSVIGYRGINIEVSMSVGLMEEVPTFSGRVKRWS